MRPRDPRLAQHYDDCRRLAADPTSSFWHDGRPARGAGHRAAYWDGRDGVPNHKHPRLTFAWAAWHAGRDDRKIEHPAKKDFASSANRANVRSPGQSRPA